MIDKELIIRKINLIAPDFEKLLKLSRKSEEDYLLDPTSEDLAERYLERVIGRMIDINFHLITETGNAPPRDYYESFLKLGELSILPIELARRVASCAGLRNRIAHEYDAIDPALVYQGLGSAALDIPHYLSCIEMYVRSLE